MSASAVNEPLKLKRPNTTLQDAKDKEEAEKHRRLQREQYEVVEQNLSLAAQQTLVGRSRAIEEQQVRMERERMQVVGSIEMTHQELAAYRSELGAERYTLEAGASQLAAGYSVLQAEQMQFSEAAGEERSRLEAAAARVNETAQRADNEMCEQKRKLNLDFKVAVSGAVNHIMNEKEAHFAQREPPPRNVACKDGARCRAQ